MNIPVWGSSIIPAPVADIHGKRSLKRPKNLNPPYILMVAAVRLAVDSMAAVLAADRRLAVAQEVSFSRIFKNSII